jgi:hypothetical protein
MRIMVKDPAQPEPIFEVSLEQHDRSVRVMVNGFEAVEIIAVKGQSRPVLSLPFESRVIFAGFKNPHGLGSLGSEDVPAGLNPSREIGELP